MLILCLALGTVRAQGPVAVSVDELLDALAPEAAEAVRNGDLEGITDWATRYEHGEGVRRNVDVAIALYCMAAVEDHVAAAYGLGWIYANGRGATRNDSVAASWMDRAARQGDDHAARMLDRLGPVPSPTREECLLSGDRSLELPLRAVPDPGRKVIVDWVMKLAPGAGIDPALVLAVIEVESAFNPNARSHKDARGLMQLLPATARRFGVSNIWDPLSNVRGGLAYMKWLKGQFDGAPKFVLAGYNAGERAVQRHGGVPPYRETRNYVKRVMAICKRARAGRYRFDLARASHRRSSSVVTAPGFPSADGLVSCQ